MSAKYYVTESVFYGMEIFLTSSQNGCYGHLTEKAAIEDAKARAQRHNKPFSVVQLIATISPEEILPIVKVTRL